MLRAVINAPIARCAFRRLSRRSCREVSCRTSD